MSLAWLSFAFLLGILLASLLGLSTTGWLLLAAASLALLIALRILLRYIRLPAFRVPRLFQAFSSLFYRIPRPAVFVPLLLCAAFLGAARYQAAQPLITSSHIAWYNDNEIEAVVVGVVDAPPERRDRYVNLWVQAESIRLADEIGSQSVTGRLLARLPLESELHYGDRVTLRGYLETPPESETFSYRAYLARQGVYSYLAYPVVGLLESGQGNPVYAAIYAFRERALGLVYRLWPDPEASLLAGILLGMESGIPADVGQAFNDTGTSHVIAISGFNITILAALFVRGFSRLLGQRRGAILAALGIALYTLLVGADAAVVRAAIMGGLALFARQVGRRQTGLNTLALTAALMALGEPLLLWDVGFQLSFAATLGLVLYAEPLDQAFRRLASRYLPERTVERLAGPVGEYFLFTVAAQITTLPLIVYHFQRFSLTSLPANFAILPAQPLLMIGGGAAVLLGLLFQPVGQLLAYFAWPFAAYTIRTVEWFAGLRGGVIVLGRVGFWVVAAFYALLLAFTLIKDRLRARLPSLRPGLVFAALAGFTVLTWSAALSAPDGRLHLTLLDVGSAESLLIESPTGRYVLINGGSSTNALSQALGRRLPLLQRSLDYLVVASPQQEQIAALPDVVARFPPERVLWAGNPHASSASRYLQRTLAEAGIPIQTAETGQVLDLGGGAHLELLAVSTRGAVLLLNWDDFRALLPVGVQFADLEGLRYGESIGSVTALLLAESGYAPLNPQEWLENLSPQVILLSVAAGDYQGRPSAETLAQLSAYSLLRTDLNGWIELSTDGHQLWVSTERR